MLTEPKKRGPGRPRTVISTQKAVELASQGLSDSEIGRALHISQPVWFRALRANDDELRNQLQAARSKSVVAVWSAMYQEALSGRHVGSAQLVLARLEQRDRATRKQRGR